MIPATPRKLFKKILRLERINSVSHFSVPLQFINRKALNFSGESVLSFDHIAATASISINMLGKNSRFTSTTVTAGK